MNSPLRLVVSASALAAAAVLVAGCAAGPGSTAPTSTSTPDAPTTPGAADSDDFDDIEAAWLDDGRMFAVVTWGSSSCVPVVDTVTAEGQTVTVSLVDAFGEDGVCTDDLNARASAAATPEGVDPTQDVELIVTYDDVTDDAELEGNAQLTAAPGSPTSFEPSAGWFDDKGLVLLTWGSSSCPPILESIEESVSAATVTFQTGDGVCTMDMAPRATTVTFSEDVEQDGFELTLAGGGLDGTVRVLGD